MGECREDERDSCRDVSLTLCATRTHHRAVSVTNALNSKNTSPEVTIAEQDRGPRWREATDALRLRWPANTIRWANHLAILEVAKRQKCK